MRKHHWWGEKKYDKVRFETYNWKVLHQNVLQQKRGEKGTAEERSIIPPEHCSAYIQTLMCCSTAPSKPKMPLYHGEVPNPLLHLYPQVGNSSFKALLCSKWAFKASTPLLPGETLWCFSNQRSHKASEGLNFIPSYSVSQHLWKPSCEFTRTALLCLRKLR